MKELLPLVGSTYDPDLILFIIYLLQTLDELLLLCTNQKRLREDGESVHLARP